MSKKWIPIICAAVLTVPLVVYGIGAVMDTGFPRNARVEISLKVNADGSGTLSIRNQSPGNLQLQETSNRMALAFLVTDHYGNVVKPAGRGKVDPAAGTFTLRPGSTHTHKFANLDFLTGTGLFGYDLEKEKQYRVVAVYRPAGSNGPGFASNECVFEYE